MSILRDLAAGTIRRFPRLRDAGVASEDFLHRQKHAIAQVLPGVIRPNPYKLMIAVTARCNARCLGCNYGRGFMPGHQLAWPMVRDLLEDAKDAGFRSIRLYGGEPLLHPDLPRMVEHCRKLGLRPYVTTNGVMLRRRIKDLFDAGLRDITVGFYGVGPAYDAYVQAPGLFARVEDGIAAVRDHCGEAVDLQMNWLLMQPTCSPEALRDAWAFAGRYGMGMRVDLIHYSLPYFSEGPDRCLQFTEADRPAIGRVVAELLRLKAAHPDRLHHTVEGLRSIPDWLLKQAAMRVPCTAYDMIWVGADGTVQLCYVTFRLGNLHEARLRDLLFTTAHGGAARDAFRLNCPNCHCSSNERIMRHGASRRLYRRPQAEAEPAP